MFITPKLTIFDVFIKHGLVIELSCLERKSKTVSEPLKFVKKVSWDKNWTNQRNSLEPENQKAQKININNSNKYFRRLKGVQQYSPLGD